jgi:hypothetical protein
VNFKTIRIHKYSTLVLGLFGRLFLRTSKYVGFEVLSAVAVALYSSVEVHRRFGGTHYLQFNVRRVGQERNQPEASSKQSLADSFDVKIEVTRSSEMSINFYQTIRRHIPED